MEDMLPEHIALVCYYLMDEVVPMRIGSDNYPALNRTAAAIALTSRAVERVVDVREQCFVFDYPREEADYTWNYCQHLEHAAFQMFARRLNSVSSLNQHWFCHIPWKSFLHAIGVFFKSHGFEQAAFLQRHGVYTDADPLFCSGRAKIWDSIVLQSTEEERAFIMIILFADTKCDVVEDRPFYRICPLLRQRRLGADDDGGGGGSRKRQRLE